MSLGLHVVREYISVFDFNIMLFILYLVKVKLEAVDIGKSRTENEVPNAVFSLLIFL